MRKKFLVLAVCLVLLVLFSAVSFASIHGLFEGYPIVKVVVDGQEISGNVPAINFNGRTMVPVRFVSDALGANVTWDAKNETVVINTGKTSTPNPTPASGQNEYTVKDTNGKALYSFKINKITTMTERNQYSDKHPAQVIMIDYTYTNIANGEDVYLSDLYFKVIDSGGKMGYLYPNSPLYYPQKTPVGAYCTAQMIFGLDTKSNTVKLCFYQGMFDNSATVTFTIPVQ